MRKIFKEVTDAFHHKIEKGNSFPVTKRTQVRSVNRRHAQSLNEIDLVKVTGNIRVSKNDPMALQKLELKLASLISLQENMFRTNEFLKNKDRAGLLQYGYSAEGVEELFLCGPGQQLGFSAQEVANMAAEIVTVQNRIASHAAAQVTQSSSAYIDEPVVYLHPQLPLTSVRQLFGSRSAAWRISLAKVHTADDAHTNGFEEIKPKVTYH